VIDVPVSGVGREASEAIARKLWAINCVHSVLTSERQEHSAFTARFKHTER
jgi:hypothetical protein